MKPILKNKRGNILTENIIFIILNLVFLSILILFIFSKTGSPAVLEEKYAKQIALIIDSAEPVMAISLGMNDAVSSARGEGINLDDAVSIDTNIVTVRLRDGVGYSYSFFNDVDATIKFNPKTEAYELFVGKIIK
ncbi:MAG: hypothetical protein KJ905_01655 [Nanoarchaeota archaeon]|nr:hypothetical protein [Nanoarchaeota archaeon]